MSRARQRKRNAARREYQAAPEKAQIGTPRGGYAAITAELSARSASKAAGRRKVGVADLPLFMPPPAVVKKARKSAARP